LKYSNIDERIGSIDYPFTLRTILVNFGPLTPDITSVKSATFYNVKNRHIPANISENTAPIFTMFKALVDVCMEIIKIT